MGITKVVVVVLVMLLFMEAVPMGNSRISPEVVLKNRIAKTERVVLNRSRSLAADNGRKDRGKPPAPKLKSPNPGPSRPVRNPEAPPSSPPPPLYSLPPPPPDAS